MAELVKKTIKWKDDQTEATALFGVGDFDEILDLDVFYWVEEKSNLEHLKDKNGVEDFYIIN